MKMQNIRSVSPKYFSKRKTTKASKKNKIGFPCVNNTDCMNNNCVTNKCIRKRRKSKSKSK